MPHRRRPRVRRGEPQHLTLRLRAGLPSLRQKRTYRIIYRAFADGCARFDFRLVHYSVQTNHLHLLVEAPDARALSRCAEHQRAAAPPRRRRATA